LPHYPFKTLLRVFI